MTPIITGTNKVTTTGRRVQINTLGSPMNMKGSNVVRVNCDMS